MLLKLKGEFCFQCLYDILAQQNQLRMFLAKKYKFTSATVSQLAKDPVKVDEETGRKILNLMEALDDSEDVQKIYTNFELPESLIGK